MQSNSLIILLNSKTQSSRRILGFAVFILVSNLAFHGILFFFNEWQYFWLLSLVSICLIWIFIKVEESCFHKKIKPKLIKQLVLENFPNFEYVLTKSISLGEFQQSKLFPKGDYLLKGNSLLKDRTRGTFISNLRINKNQAKYSKPATIFEGLLVKIQISQSTDQPIFITPKPDFYKINIPSFLQKLVHPLFPLENKVFIKQNDHFNSKYDIYSFSKLDINDVINPKVIDGILKLDQLLDQKDFSKSKKKMFGSFSPNREVPCELEFSIVDQFFFIGIKGFQIFELNWRQSRKDLTNYCNQCLDVLKTLNEIQTNQKN